MPLEEVEKGSTLTTLGEWGRNRQLSGAWKAEARQDERAGLRESTVPSRVEVSEQEGTGVNLEPLTHPAARGCGLRLGSLGLFPVRDRRTGVSVARAGGVRVVALWPS